MGERGREGGTGMMNNDNISQYFLLSHRVEEYKVFNTTSKPAARVPDDKCLYSTLEIAPAAKMKFQTTYTYLQA